MSNVVAFPMSRWTPGGEDHRLGGAPLDGPPDPASAAPFLDDEELLVDTVGQFLAAGLLAGDGLLVIAQDHHRERFEERLEDLDIEAARASGQLVVVDAHETLETFMVGGIPDPARFRAAFARLMSRVTTESRLPRRVRVYGEMVDILWRRGNLTAAIRLEELWKAAADQCDFSLLGAHLMGHFYKEGDTARFIARPAESFAGVDESTVRLREVALLQQLQQRARSLEYELQQHAELERALRAALEEGRRTEVALRDCLRRERAAQASAATLPRCSSASSDALCRAR